MPVFPAGLHSRTRRVKGRKCAPEVIVPQAHHKAASARLSAHTN